MTNRYLIDTNVISELRKGGKMDAGVRKFFAKAEQENAAFFVSVITIGELRRGVEIIRHRGDYPQAEMLDAWLQTIIDNYAENILEFRYPDGGQNKKTFCPPYTANSGYPQRKRFHSNRCHAAEPVSKAG